MSDIFSFLKNFFEQRKPKGDKTLFLHEAIDFARFPIERVSDWEKQGGYTDFATLITTAYNSLYIKGEQNVDSDPIVILRKSHSNGWFIKANNMGYEDQSYKYFCYLLTQKIKELGYIVQVAELKSLSTPGGIEVITHYYLKPSLKSRFQQSSGLANQLYGNISIEYIALDSSPQSLKFVAHAYHDAKYTPPLDFTDLVDALFRA